MLLQDKDYLERKLENKASFDAITGATEQDKFNNLGSDSEKLRVIEFNNISGAVAVPFLMTANSIDQATATMMFGGIQLKSYEDNAKACEIRFNDKANGWFPIFFTYFDAPTAQSITNAISVYVDSYIKYAKFGKSWGDTEFGLLDFINNTNGITSSLEDYPLISGTDYTAVQTALTQYFRG